MNNELNKWLAEKVMGWGTELSKITNKPRKTMIYFNPNDHADWIECSSWRPDENIEHAMMCLDTFTNFSIGKWVDTPEPYTVTIYDQNQFCVDHESLPMAISLACAKATGWSE